MELNFKTSLARDTWDTKYRYDNETPVETFERLARALAAVETDPDHWYPIFLQTLLRIEDGQVKGIKCTPGGRITANAGTSYSASMFNCYITGPVKNARIEYDRVVPGTDISIPVRYKTRDTGDDMMNIMLTVLEQAKTLGSEGGWGINIGFIRPRGAIVKAIGVQHPGIVKFLEIFDKVSDVIVCGNNDGYKDRLTNHISEENLNTLQGLYSGPLKKMARKGAMMVCLDIDHPDIEEFVRAKQSPGRLTKFNMSVLVTDKFMKAVESDSMFDLTFDGIIYKTLKARELYDLIMESTFNRAEPGVLFYDAMQRNNPLSYTGPINSTNPCGEIGGNPITTTVCLLGSLNVTQYVQPNRKFDFETFSNDIYVFARMLDNVNDLQKTDLDPYLWAIKNVRQYGMGLNGFGSALYMLGIPYNSRQAIKFAEKLNRLKLNQCFRATADLAKEKGTAPVFDREKYFSTVYWTEFLKGKLDEDVIEKVKEYGVRNMKLGTNPPLGNSSVLCDMTSNGLEPVFMHFYDRYVIASEWPEGLSQENVHTVLTERKIGDATVWEGQFGDRIYYYEPHNRGLCIKERVYDYGYEWVKEHYPEDVKSNADSLVTTNDLQVDDHVAIQAAFQKFVDQSVSKTVNIPNDFPFEDFKAAYMKAWKAGLNGFTTYRDGTMEAVLAKVDDGESEAEARQVLKSVQLPNTFINGPTDVIRREGIKYYIHFSYLPEDIQHKYPIALWINTNHRYRNEAIYVNRAVRSLQQLLLTFDVDERLVNENLEKLAEDFPHVKLAKMVSMCLRHNLPISSIIISLENLDGDYISSLLTALRKFLAQHVKDGAKAPGKKCSVCGGGQVIFESGCSKCLDCGTSNCG